MIMKSVNTWLSRLERRYDVLGEVYASGVSLWLFYLKFVISEGFLPLTHHLNQDNHHIPIYLMYTQSKVLYVSARY